MDDDGPIDQLARCTSSEEVLAVIAKTPALRTRATVTDLIDRANAILRTNRPLAEQMATISADLHHLLDCIDAAPGDGTTAAVNEWLREHPHAWHGTTRSIILQECRDLRRRGDDATRRRLVNALVTLRRTERFNEWVCKKVTNKDSDLLDAMEAQQEVPLVDYLEWLAIRGDLGDENAPALLGLREYISTWKHVRGYTLTPSSRPGYVGSRMPSTDGVAHAWMYKEPDFLERCKQRLADTQPNDWNRVRSELVAAYLKEDIADITAQTIDEMGGSGEEGVRIYTVTVICEAALSSAPLLTEVVLATYRETVESDACRALPKILHDVHVYHYLYALLAMWARLAEPRPVLDAAIVLAESVLSTLDSNRPRLLRDLRFVCARLCGRLGQWDRRFFLRAVEHYRTGLEINALKEERDPRARALADLANTLHRSGLGSPKEVEALFKEALALRPVDEASVSSVSGRLNYAIFLFERIGTTVAKSKAIELLEIAERVHPQIDEETRDTPWCRELLAGIWMTKANIRREDATETAIRESLALYEKATTFIGDDPWFRPLRGPLAMNQCFAQLDLHDLTGAEHHLVSADIASREATAAAIDDAGRLEARLCDALVALRGGDTPANVLPIIDECAKASRGAGGLVRSLSAIAWRARLGLATGTEEEAEEARRLFREGFEAAHEAGLFFEYLLHARGFADACVAGWRRSQDPALIAGATEVLEAVRSTIEEKLEHDVLLVDPDNAHAHLAAVAAELTWLRATAGAAVEAILAEATIAKGPETKIDLVIRAAMSSLSSTAATELSTLRREDWRIRRDVVQRDRLDARLVTDVDELTAADHRRAITLGKRRRELLAEPVEFEKIRLVEGVIVDVTTCRWGSVLVTVAASGPPSVATVPFTLTTFERLQREWLEAYAATHQPSRDLTEQLLQTVATEFERSLRDCLSDERVVWVPHILSGLPLQGLPLEGRRLVEATDRVSFASSLLAVKAPTRALWSGKQVLCMALDPGGREELVNACPEVAAATKLLLDAGAEVTVVADSGGKPGLEAFQLRNVSLDPRARCEKPKSLAEWIIENIATFDHVLIASHAAYGTEGGALVLPTGGVSILDLLATCELKPRSSVHLSACETAMRLGVVYSLAGGLLHLGASFVLGTAWTVRDKDALRFSSEFYRLITDGGQDFEHAAMLAMRELRQDVGDDKIEFWSPFLPLIG